MVATFFKGKEALLKWFANNGFAVCVALMLFYGIATTVAWIATEFLIPARDRVFIHLDTVEELAREKLDAIKLAILEQEAAIRSVERQSEVHQRTTEKVAAATSETAATLEQVVSVLREIRDEAKTIPKVIKPLIGSASPDPKTATTEPPG